MSMKISSINFLSVQTASWDIANILSMANSMAQEGYVFPSDKPVMICREKTAIDKGISFVDALSQIEVKEDRKFDLFGKKVTFDEIIEKLSNLPKTKKDLVAVVGGNHKTAAALLVFAFTGKDLDIPVVEVGEDWEVKALMSNVANGVMRRLSKEQKLLSVVPLVESGKITKASQLEALGFKHGEATYMYAKAYMVVFQGVSFEDALRVSDKKAGKIKNLGEPEKVQAAVSEDIEGKDPVLPTITKSQYKETFSLVKSESLKSLGKAIQEGDLVTFRKTLLELDG